MFSPVNALRGGRFSAGGSGGTQLYSASSERNGKVPTSNGKSSVSSAINLRYVTIFHIDIKGVYVYLFLLG